MNSSQMFCKKDAPTYAFQHSKENTFAGAYFLINENTGLQVQPNFVKKDAPSLVFS